MTEPKAAPADRPREKHLQQAAIHFAPDAYDSAQRDIVGRRIASSGFLRAAIASASAPVVGYGNSQNAEAFKEMVAVVSPGTETSWISADQVERLSAVGMLYRPDPKISEDARLRLRVGPDRYSLCGVFHTTALALPEIASMFREPLMPWDAVVCPSTSVRETVTRIEEAERDYLRWRFRSKVEITGPTFPVIPLGVDCSQSRATDQEKSEAREKLGVNPDAIVVLFVGRLSYTLKAHPYATYVALQAVAACKEHSITFIQCGYFPSKGVEESFRSGASEFAPDVQAIFADGRDSETRRKCWAAADIFISLADNLQETFGLTPLEAMAAGIPVLVTDWDGYRDTVRNGVDGFLVTTWGPAPGAGERYALALEAGTIPANLFWWTTAATTSVVMTELVSRLTLLVSNRDLRKKMGNAAYHHARRTFDWKHIFSQYEMLWFELQERRLAATRSDRAWLLACPGRAGGQLEPFSAFGHYPSKSIGPRTRFLSVSSTTVDRYRKLVDHQLFPVTPATLEQVEAIFELLDRARTPTVSDAAHALGINTNAAILLVAALAKMDLLQLDG